MSMSENPYEAPRSVDRVVGVKSGKREDLRSVALYQKVIIICVLCYIVIFVAQTGLRVSPQPGVPAGMILVLALVGLAIILTGVVFTFLLAIKVYNVAVGILLGIGAMIPCVGLLVLLAVSNRATAILRENGIRVGFLGADLSAFR